MIKHKDLRAAELRRIADMIEKGGDVEVTALTIGIALTLDVGGQAMPNSLTYWAGDKDISMDLIRQAARRLPEGTPFELSASDLEPGMSKVAVASDKNEEPDTNPFETLDDLINLMKLVSSIVPPQS